MADNKQVETFIRIRGSCSCGQTVDLTGVGKPYDHCGFFIIKTDERIICAKCGKDMEVQPVKITDTRTEEKLSH